MRPSVFSFGRQLSAASSVEELRADDDATLLLDALQRLPARFGADRPAGVVIFSDGRTTETSGFQEAADSYRKSGMPLHVFPVSDQGVMGDVVIQELVVPRFAPAGSRVPVHVQIAGYGFQGRQAEIRIRAAANPGARPLAAIPVTLSGAAETYDLMIEPDQAPGGDMVLEIPPLPGEAVTDNNQVPFRIASQVKKLRVIYMEATLGDEYHWLRDAIVEDPTIECVAMEVQNQYVRNQRLQRVGDPSRGYPETREELFHYDVVICSDIRREAFSQEQLQWTRDLVAQRGGGFAMVGGNTSFGAGGWDQTIWDELIPVKMSGDRPHSLGQGYTGGTFRVLVPPTAERHPIWRIAEDPQQNAAILAAMPQFYGTNLIDRVKPGATVLGLTDRPMPLAGVMPIFACQQFGRGRTFAMTTDTTVEWGRDFESQWGEGDNRYFKKFWRNVVKWLAENSIGGTQRLRIETDKVIYRPGQPIQVAAHAYDDKLEETGKYRIFARLKPATEVANGVASSPPTLEETPLLPGGGELTYRGRLTAPPISALKTESPGVFLFVADHGVGGNRVRRRLCRRPRRTRRASSRRLGRVPRPSPRSRTPGTVGTNQRRPGAAQLARVEPPAGEHQAGGGRSGRRPPARLGQSRPVVPLAPAVDSRMDVPPLPRAGVRFRHRGNSFRRLCYCITTGCASDGNTTSPRSSVRLRDLGHDRTIHASLRVFAEELLPS